LYAVGPSEERAHTHALAAADTYTLTYAHTRTHTYAHMRTYTHICTHAHIHLHTHWPQEDYKTRISQLEAIVSDDSQVVILLNEIRLLK
jgi:hypothetical protein